MNIVYNDIAMCDNTISPIDTYDMLDANLKSHCLPANFKELDQTNYNEFLIERRKLMAQMIKEYYFSL